MPDSMPDVKRTWHQMWTDTLRDARLDPTRFTVLTHLGYHADYETGERCYPSLSTLADRAGISLATLKRYLGLLEAEGWIARDVGTRGRATRYQLNPLSKCDRLNLSLAQSEPGSNRANGRLNLSRGLAQSEPRSPSLPPTVSPSGGEKEARPLPTPARESERTHEGAQEREDVQASGRGMALKVAAEGERVDQATIKARAGEIAAQWREGFIFYERTPPSPARLADLIRAHMDAAPDACERAHMDFISDWINDLCASQMADGALMSRIVRDVRDGLAAYCAAWRPAPPAPKPPTAEELRAEAARQEEIHRQREEQAEQERIEAQAWHAQQIQRRAAERVEREERVAREREELEAVRAQLAERARQRAERGEVWP